MTIFSVLGLFLDAFDRNTNQTGLNTESDRVGGCINLHQISKIISILRHSCTEELKDEIRMLFHGYFSLMLALFSGFTF